MSAIREERAGDADAIAALVTAAFATAEHRSGTEALIVARLREADALALSLVAEEDGVIVGHAAFSPVAIDGQDRGWLGLGPVSVAPGRQRCGIGAALVRAGLERLGAAAGCVVLGDPAYYARFGFIADAALAYPGPPPAYFQSLVLAGPPARGTVSYHEAFA